jgi:hypothetical protein
MTPAKFELLSNRQLEIVTERKDNNQPPPIFATPYTWKNPATLRRREWLYGYLLIRKLSMIAPAAWCLRARSI